jgi:hypothetical protein
MNINTIVPGADLRERPRAQERLGRVETTQRSTVVRSCAVCGGYDRAPRGQCMRCFGFRSTKGPYVFCTREELAVQLSFNTTVLAYRHTFEGACGCGDAHQEAPRMRARSTPEGDSDDPSRVGATYNYHDAGGTLRYQIVRYQPKGFAVRRLNGDGSWVYNLDGIPWVPYRLSAVLQADPNEPVFVVEGEKDVRGLERGG